MAGIGPLELVIVLVIILIVFGPKRLPGLGKQLGSGMREFKESITGDSKDDDDERPQITKASADEAPPTGGAGSDTATEREDAVSQPRG